MGEIPYYVVAGGLAFAAVANPRQRVNALAWTAAFFVLLIFVGFRHKIGMDWNNYVRMTDYIAGGTLLDSLSRVEPTFAILTWLSAWLGMGVYGVNFVCATLFLLGLFRFCLRAENPWLGLLVAFPMLTMVVACSASRQSAAIGILLWLLADWRNQSFIMRVAFILAASSFHYSAAFLLCFVALELEVSPRAKAAAFVVSLVGTAWLMIASGGGDYYITTYVTEQTEEVYSSGAFFHVLLNAGPASLVLVSKRLRQTLFPTQILRNLAYSALLLVPVVFFASLAAGRLSLYLFPVSIMVVSRIPSLASSPVARALVRLVFCLLLIAMCWYWLNFSNSGRAYIPYGNALFLDSDELHL